MPHQNDRNRYFASLIGLIGEYYEVRINGGYIMLKN